MGIEPFSLDPLSILLIREDEDVEVEIIASCWESGTHRTTQPVEREIDGHDSMGASPFELSWNLHL